MTMGKALCFCLEAPRSPYAERIIRELKEAGGYDDPGLMIVKDDTGKVIHSIPF